MDVLHVDCSTCRARGPACADCVISVLLGPIEQAVLLDGDEQQALRAMAGSGLLPPLRVVPLTRAGGTAERGGPRTGSAAEHGRRPGPTGFAKARIAP